jgi:glycogen debranching enzyme
MYGVICNVTPYIHKVFCVEYAVLPGVEEDMNIRLEHIKNCLKYGRLDDHGQKLGETNRKSVSLSVFSDESYCKPSHRSPIIESYFVRIPGGEKEPLECSLAVNGLLWNADPIANFALPSKAYFQRTVTMK